MSLAIEAIPVCLVEDTRTSFPPFSLPARVGVAGNSFLFQDADTKGSNIVYSWEPPSPQDSVIPHTMIQQIIVTLTITGATAGTGNLFAQGSFDAPRAFPMESCFDTKQLELNGTSFIVNNNKEIGHVLRRFNPKKSLFKNCNFCPWYPDTGVATYSDLVGSNRNPLGAGTTGDIDLTRGCYGMSTYTNGIGGLNLTTSGTVQLETWEPFVLDPFKYDPTAQGLPYIYKIDINQSINGNSWARALSHATNAVRGSIANANVTANVTTARMWYQSVKIPSLSRGIGPVVQMPYYSLKVDQTVGTVPARVPTLGMDIKSQGSTLTSAILNYGVMPSRFYIFAQPSVLTAQHPDSTHTYTGNLTVMAGADQKMMNVSPRQLYSSAVDAGYSYPWENFAGFYNFTGAGTNAPTTVIGSSGSIITLRPGIDFDLPAGVVPGQAGAFRFQFSADFLEQRAASSGQSTLYVVAVLPGVVSFGSEREVIKKQGVISQNDVMNATEKVREGDVLDAYGSGFFDTIKAALPMLQSGARYAHAGLSAAKSAGLLGGSSMTGGSAMTGGAMLTPAQIAARHR
jgi:hypothetical protein